jgi:hypothetical protein
LKKKSSQNVVKTIENDVEIFFEQFVVILVSGAFFLTSVHRKEGSFSDGLNKKKKKKKKSKNAKQAVSAMEHMYTMLG